MPSDKYLTMKEVAECFKQLDFDERDAVNISFLDSIYTNNTYFMENGALKLCSDLFHQNPKNWITETEFYLEKKEIRSMSVRDIKKTNINHLCIKDDKVFRDKASRIINEQNEANKKLIAFIKICCPILNKALADRIIEENNNFRDNKISLNTAAALLTTWLFIEKRYKLLQPKNHSDKNNFNKLANDKLKKIKCRLVNELQTESSETIKIAVFLEWLAKNSKDFPMLCPEIDKYYKLLPQGNTLCNSMKNSFIAHTLIKLVYNTIKAAETLNSLSTDSIISIDTNINNPNENGAVLYSKKVTQFAKKFIPIKLSELAEKNNLSAQAMFQKILANKLRWFVKIDKTNIYNLAGKYQGWAQGWPKLEIIKNLDSNNERPTPIHNEEVEIKKALDLIPFYKIAEKELLFEKDINIETSLKNTGEANLNEPFILELPEELYFLNVHYGYYVTLPRTKESCYTKLAIDKITLDDIVLPECEAHFINELYDKKTVGQLPNNTAPLAPILSEEKNIPYEKRAKTNKEIFDASKYKPANMLDVLWLALKETEKAREKQYKIHTVCNKLNAYIREKKYKDILTNDEETYNVYYSPHIRHGGKWTRKTVGNNIGKVEKNYKFTGTIIK